MEPVFKISKIGEFGILIEGLSCDSDQYQNPGAVISRDLYKWEESVTINILFSVNSKGEETFEDYLILEHLNECSDRSTFELSKDGLYKVVHIILPTKAWAEAYLDSEGHEGNKKDKVIYYDNGNLCITEGLIEDKVDFSITELYEELAGYGNTIKRVDKQTFIASYLQSCLNSLIQKALNLLGDACGQCETSEYKIVTTNRDIVWMFVNAVKYSLELKQLYRAQKLIEQFWRCNTFCKPYYNNNNKYKTNDCGCC